MVGYGVVHSMFVLLLVSPTVVNGQTQRVPIDVAPGNAETEIEAGRGGLLPVAVLSTPAFDATTVDQTTIRFGLKGTEASPLRTVIEDVDRDGRLDLVSLIRMTDLDLPCGGTELRLTAETGSGDSIEGSERVTVIGCTPN